jgi:hypothetical protein
MDIKINENEDLKNFIPNLTSINYKSSLQILNSINNDLDTLSTHLKHNNIIKQPFSYNYGKNIDNFPIVNKNNYYYDKEDLEMKELLIKANILLKDNNLPKQIIKNYENKLHQSYLDNRANNNYNFNHNRKYDNNFSKFRKNYHLNNNDFLFNSEKRKKENNYLNSQFFYRNYSNNNIKKDNKYNKFQSKKYILKNSLEKNINKRIKKLENVALYINDHKRKPHVYSQPNSKRFNTNINYRFT